MWFPGEGSSELVLILSTGVGQTSPKPHFR